MCCCCKGSSRAGLIASIAGALSIIALSAFNARGDDPGEGVLDRTMRTITGEDKPLSDFRGEVILIVNTASRCGLTPQYEGLESLYESRHDKGFVILGFPANNFAGQEPGSDSEIAEFCRLNYGVTFPMFARISVKGAEIDPLYATLTTMPAPIGGEVQWNFQKYVVDRKGNVVARFEPRTSPDDPALVELIDSLLATPKN
jgi:glutathione peroxidase